MLDRMRVLLVQADEAERRTHALLFGGAGMLVDEAGSGAQALEKLSSIPPDLVVLGRQLPDMDGLDLIPRLKTGELDFFPVLVASQKSSTADRVQGLSLGADDYLARPCDPAELLARAKALLRVKQTHDRVRRAQVDLERLVVSDPLTGLYNRRFLLDRLAQEMQRARRYEQPLAFAMIDLDGFKPVNDEYGHAFGDRALRSVASAIGRCVRLADVAGRYGGDEFAVLLPSTPPAGAARVCERILRTVSELRVADERGRQARLSASLGLAWFPVEDILAPEDLVRAADEALYGAKRAGKNRFSAVRAVDAA